MGDEGVGRVYLYVALLSMSLSVVLSSISLVKELVGRGSGLYLLAEGFEALPGDLQLGLKVFLLLGAVAGFLLYREGREE